MRQPDSHPNVETLKAFGMGRVGGPAAETIHNHLETCIECRSVVADVAVVHDVGQSPETARPPQSAGAEANDSGVNPPDAPNRFRLAPTLRPSQAAAEMEPAPVVVAPIPVALAASSEHEVIREISRGGMGVVYLARNRRMDRLEALKVVKGALLEQAGSLERFEREMKAAARLNHPNIVTAYSSPSLDGLLAFAMEYVDGTDLYELVQERGPLPVSNACYYVYQTAQGLQHALDRQMVHRDIKPNNLMLTRDGKKQLVKILDFGLAKATSENPTGAGFTQTGQMIGTPLYMAPEQIVDAARADIRADIYGLGCTLYYLLTGHPPFPDKGSLYAILHAHQSEIARPLNEVRPDVPAELAQIVGKMMVKDAAQRYQQPAGVAQALAPFFKQGIKPIPVGTARFAAPSAAQIPPETAGSKAAEATPMPSPAAVPVPSVPAQNTANPPAGTRPDEPNPIQTMLEFVPEPPRSPAANRSGRGGARRTSSKSVPPKIWLGVAAAIILLAGLGLWASGLLTVKVKTGKGTLVVDVNVPDAAILVDGEQVTVEWSSGKQKATVGVESGTRNVEVKKEGFTAVAETLTFKDGKETVFTATLERNRPEPPKADAESSAPAPAKSVTKNEPETGNMPPADTPAPAKAPAPSQIASKVDSRAAAAATFTNSLGMEFALIPAGKFRMGSPASEKDRSSDEAQVDVTLTKSFYLGKTEVTQGQWRAVMGTTPWKGKSFVKEGDNYPATYLSWEDAQAFCKKLSEKENGKYRLPTEAEWEYACRGGSTTRFSFGDNEAQLGGFAWYDRNADAIGEEYAHEVGKKQANSFGLHDMHGNVWEWCEDVYAAKLQGGMDPLVSSGGSHRVVRGGSWLSEASRCRSALRGRFAPDYRRDYLGFRVARVPGSQ